MDFLRRPQWKRQDLLVVSSIAWISAVGLAILMAYENSSLFLTIFFVVTLAAGPLGALLCYLFQRPSYSKCVNLASHSFPAAFFNFMEQHHQQEYERTWGCKVPAPGRRRKFLEDGRLAALLAIKILNESAPGKAIVLVGSTLPQNDGFPDEALVGSGAILPANRRS